MGTAGLSLLQIGLTLATNAVSISEIQSALLAGLIPLDSAKRRSLLSILAIAASAVITGRVATPGFAIPLADVSFTDEHGGLRTLADFQGKVVILDFWATWCKPCRDEFPILDRLQARLGPEGVAVVPICVNRDGLAAIDAFYEQLKIVHLAKYSGTLQAAVKGFGVQGLPTAILLDRNGNEAFRVDGAVDWEGAELDGVLRRLIAR